METPKRSTDSGTITECHHGEKYAVPQAGPARNREWRRGPRRRSAVRTVTVEDAVARALEIGPDSSAAERTIEITTMGARSGLPRRIEIWLHHIDGRWYLSGMPVARSWYANLRANPKFVVPLKRGVPADLPATAVPVD